jgi:hypothetical protein
MHLVFFWLLLLLFGSALASENLEPGPAQAMAFGRDFSEALALALLDPRPGQSHLEPKPEKAKAEP